MQTAINVADAFSKFRMPAIPEIDQFDTVGRNVLIDKMTPYILQNRPIEFVMLGYPFKSKNHRDKTLGELPDLGEEISLRNFDTFNKVVKDVYSPGVNINLVSDGLAFNRIMDVSDYIVDQYGEINRDTTKNMSVKWHDMRSFYSKELTTDQMRSKVNERFGISEIELERRILTDPDVNSMYRGMIRFLNLDLAIDVYPNSSQLQKAAKMTAKKMMLLNESYSTLIANEFKDAVRLSMHPSLNSGKKFSFQLIPSEKAKMSPWHCAIYIHSDGEFETIHKMDAERLKLNLVNKNNKPWYYEA